jgi:hypothetical protein
VKQPNFPSHDHVHVTVYVTHGNPDTLDAHNLFQERIMSGIFPLVAQSALGALSNAVCTQEFHIVPRPKAEFMTFLQAVEAMHAGAVVARDAVRDYASFMIYWIGPHPDHGRPVILQRPNDNPNIKEPARLWYPSGAEISNATDWIIVEPDADGKVPGGKDGFDKLTTLFLQGKRAKAPDWPAGMYLEVRPTGFEGRLDELVLVGAQGTLERWPMGTMWPREWNRITWEEATTK